MINMDCYYSGICLVYSKYGDAGCTGCTHDEDGTYRKLEDDKE